MDRAGRTATKTVVFLCTGNYFRSRFSEYLFNARAEERGLAWRATSRGLKTELVDGLGPISPYTAEGLAQRDIRLCEPVRFPLPLCETDLLSADLVIAVKEAEHRPLMAAKFPAWTDRIHYWHVDDIDCALPDDSLCVCESLVEALLERLAAEEAAPRREAA